MLRIERSVRPAVRESFNRVAKVASCKAEGSKSPKSIQVVENALLLLEKICEIDGDIRVTELSEKLGMNKSSVWRLLATFTKRGYLEREESGRYRLGMAAQLLSIKFRLRSGLLNKARPVMNQLARDCNEAVYLAIPHGKSFILVDMVDTVHAVRIMPLLGKSYPVSTTSVGKVLRAFSPGREDRSKEAAELESIRREGAGIDSGGFGEGTVCAAFPLFDAQKQICGCLCTIGPEFRFTHERMAEELLPLFKEASRVISSQLGYMH